MTFLSAITGSATSKYEHQRASALLRNIQNIGICMGKKHYRFRNLRKWKDLNKNSLPYLKCVLHLSCVRNVGNEGKPYIERKPFT